RKGELSSGTFCDNISLGIIPARGDPGSPRPFLMRLQPPRGKKRARSGPRNSFLVRGVNDDQAGAAHCPRPSPEMHTALAERQQKVRISTTMGRAPPK